MLVNKKIFLLALSMVLILSVGLLGCTTEEPASQDQTSETETEQGQQENRKEDEGVSNAGEGLHIATSFSILADIVQNIIGERGQVEYVVPIGEEPHEYEPVPSDFKTISDADVFYVNGLDLEQWLEKVVSNVTDTEMVSVSEGVTTISLVGEDGTDPHAWLNPKHVITYVEIITEDLIARDPAGEEIYRQNSEQYIAQLKELDAWIEEQVAAIPEDHRVIVISENAFKYFGERYGLQTEGIWELNSHEEGTPQQIARVVDLVKAQGIPAVFVETTVDQRYMQRVAQETGVDIAGEVYTDAVGPAGSGAETYIDLMKHNVTVFAEGLTP
ncbi:iron/zinc/copper transport system substrate-binding protein [Caldalkalibacillus uzonensis]|uniref:Iron/zinc/copper transport system substrate-binding protein n=1 Tax=Caldalkalibacillus uzonensis TaxID=353224 RepID=A0ABU0CQ02_9BACI|nr:metal ABC transporter substrate-binding protein [Caldalkalibacillus uzonensis]MDQ0338178.1 iron/zinc/copper transport system substrate-binding protein [Caldalkalibacillus uzonensis]